VRLSKIETDDDFSINKKNVANIAESIGAHGLLNPVIVRPIFEKKAKHRRLKKAVLISGADRVAAAKLAKLERIQCFYFKGDEIDSQLIKISENLWRKEFTVLRRAEMLAEWLTIASAKVNSSGQPVRKRKPGRPPAGIAMAARKLPVLGRSPDARRKIVDRAVKIAFLPSEVKAAVKGANLDNNQQALLAICKQPNVKAQLSAISDLAQSVSASNSQLSGNSESTTLNGLSKRRKTHRSDSDTEETDSERKPSPQETTFDQMKKFWRPKGAKLWTRAPADVRNRFIEMLKGARCTATPDVAAFLKRAFQGRRRLAKSDLYGLARCSGLNKPSVQKAAKQLGYRSKRVGKHSAAVWYFVNADSDWKERVPAVSESELKAARAEAETQITPKVLNWPDRDDTYYSDLMS
jgi:hypothetical protein